MKINEKSVKRPKGSIPYEGYYFLGIKKSKDPEKKLEAHFLNGKTGGEKVVSFGNANTIDYTQHKCKLIKDQYDQKFKEKNVENLMSATALDKYVLWDKTGVKSGISNYKKQLKEKKK